MNDDPLHRLKDVAPPLVDDAARARALQAAMTAYEASDRGEQKVGATKGSQGSRRPMTIFGQNTWRWIMEKRMLMGSVAAGVLLFPLAAQLVWQAGRYDVVSPQAPLEQRLDDAAGQREQEQSADLGRQRVDEATRKLETDSAGAGNVQLAEPAPQSTTAPAQEAAAKAGRLQDTIAPGIAPATPPGSALERYGAEPARQGVPGFVAQDEVRPAPYQAGGDKFAAFSNNPLKLVAQEPVSTFSIDVDSASYAYVRRALNQGHLPPADSVRVEEMINYFSYSYPLPDSREAPFRPTVAVYPSPWNANTKLMHIGIKGLDVQTAVRPQANLVFLIDVSGSMQDADKLPLLKSAFRLLLDTLQADDTVSIVTYAGNAGTVLEPTKVGEKGRILAALDELQSGGSTAGAEGIRQAYVLAEQAFIKNGVNRVLLATDGDFNVGISDPDALKHFIEEKRKSGVFLSVMGFGGGNYNDALMQALAQNGNGVAAYIDTLSEAQKVLVEEAAANLFPIAKDVKIQIEFNPSMVSEYRLIGYETRALNREDFNNDKVDAGELGSGHTVTAIYEVTPVGAQQSIDPLRYQSAGQQTRVQGQQAGDGEYGFLKLRYKLPAEEVSKLIELPITRADERAGVDRVSDDMRFAAAVAAFGQKLRGGQYIGQYGYDEIAALAASARGEDRFGYRNEFISLVRLAKVLDSGANR